MTAAVLIDRENLGYGDKVVLQDVALSLMPGERVVFLGRSGAGKSTLLAALYHRLTAQGRRVALAPQDHALVPPLSVFHNVFMGRLDERGAVRNLLTLIRPSAAERALVRPVLEAVGLAAEERRAVESLSGGQKQRVALARALFRGGEVLIADEPVSAVDESQARRLLIEAESRFHTSLLALHDVDLALSHASRVVGVGAGRILFDRAAGAVDRREIDALYAL